ncbi:hypothetical protein Hanom_Chr07g00674671 [Helianthus anomalus]
MIKTSTELISPQRRQRIYRYRLLKLAIVPLWLPFLPYQLEVCQQLHTSYTLSFNHTQIQRYFLKLSSELLVSQR